MESVIPLGEMPTELTSHICSYIEQREISSLCMTAKQVYKRVRPILYYCPIVASFPSLVFFNRTLTEATYLGKTNIKWSSRESLDQTKYLDLTLDPTRDNGKSSGGTTTAILVSRILQSIERRCPSIQITLSFVHCHCGAAPVKDLRLETFPRVQKLNLYVGNHDPDETQPRGDPRCQRDPGFWDPLFDGLGFPDCKSIKVRHHWGIEPPKRSNLDLSENCGSVYRGWLERARGRHLGSRGSVSFNRSDASSARHGSNAQMTGLEKLEAIFLEYVPELDASILMQILGNPKSSAVNLTSLELRFCDLANDTMAQLLYHAPPNIKRLVLLCRHDSDNGGGPHGDGWNDGLDENLQGKAANSHLCPLVRAFAKNLVHLEFGADHICKQLFYDDAEIESLWRDGVMPHQEGSVNFLGENDRLDAHAIQQTVQRSREKKRAVERQRRINEAILEAQAASKIDAASKSLFGSGAKSLLDTRIIKRDTEIILDEEEAKRERLIEGFKEGWFRRFIAWRGLCGFSGVFEELQIAADMEEAGITWVLANKGRMAASQHRRNRLPLELSMERAMEEQYRFAE